MSTAPAEALEAWPEQPLESPAFRAPSLGTHTVVLVVLLVFGAPAAYFIRAGDLLAGTLMAAVPFTVVCLLEPFIGLCYLFAISPLDCIYDVGIPYFSGSKALGIPVGLGFLIHFAFRPEMRFHVAREVKVLWALAIWSLLSAAWSVAPLHTMFSCTSLFLLSTFMLLVVGMVRTPAHMKQLLLYVLIGCLLMGALATVAPSNIAVAKRKTFSEVNPNNFGRALAFGVFCGIFLAGQARRGLGKFFYGFAAAFLLVPIVGTLSRGTFFALGGAVLGASVVTFRRHSLKGLTLIAGAAVLTVGLVYALNRAGFFVGTSVERLSTPLAEAGESRFAIWQAGMNVGFQRPIRGWGFGTFSYASGTGRDPHDNYLKLFTELGFPGLGLWLLALTLAGLSALRAPTGRRSFLTAGLLSMLLLGGVFMNDFSTKTVWYELGVILAMNYMIASGADRGDFPPEAEELDWAGYGP